MHNVFLKYNLHRLKYLFSKKIIFCNNFSGNTLFILVYYWVIYSKSFMYSAENVVL